MDKLQPKDFNAPAILLGGPVDYDMHKDFRKQLDASKKEGLIVTELSTLGGDPEVARMMGEDIRFHSENPPGAGSSFWGRRRSIRRNNLHEFLCDRESISDARNAFNDP